MRNDGAVLTLIGILTRHLDADQLAEAAAELQAAADREADPDAQRMLIAASEALRAPGKL